MNDVIDRSLPLIRDFDNKDTEVVSESQPTKAIQFITFVFYISAPSRLKLKVTIKVLKVFIDIALSLI